MHCPKVQHKYSRMGRSNPDVKPPLDRLKAVVKEWPESFKMKDELVRVLEQMLSFQPSDRPTADQLLLLPLLGRFAPQHIEAVSVSNLNRLAAMARISRSRRQDCR